MLVVWRRKYIPRSKIMRTSAKSMQCCVLKEVLTMPGCGAEIDGIRRHVHAGLYDCSLRYCESAKSIAR